MTTYLIEIYVPRYSSPLAVAHPRGCARSSCPSDEIGYCLVEAPSATAAAELAATLGLEPERIV